MTEYGSQPLPYLTLTEVMVTKLDLRCNLLYRHVNLTSHPQLQITDDDSKQQLLVDVRLAARLYSNFVSIFAVTKFRWIPSVRVNSFNYNNTYTCPFIQKNGHVVSSIDLSKSNRRSFS